jgi:hypothetical protein
MQPFLKSCARLAKPPFRDRIHQAEHEHLFSIPGLLAHVACGIAREALYLSPARRACGESFDNPRPYVRPLVIGT